MQTLVLFMLGCVRVPKATRIVCRLTPKGMLRYPDVNSHGLFRDAANVAMLALMYADLPAVTPQRQKWARCIARQTVNYILGDNPSQWSYMVGFGYGLASFLL
jgi:hypothetical protein